MTEQKTLGQVAYETLQGVMQPIYGGEKMTWEEACAEAPTFGAAFDEFAAKLQAEVIARGIEALADKGIEKEM